MVVRALLALFFAVIPGQLSLSGDNYDYSDSLQQLVLQMHNKVNELRAQRNLPPLSWNVQLAAEAQRHAQNMAHFGFFDHKDPSRGDLNDRLTAAGIAWRRCAENLYLKQGKKSDLAEEAVSGWLKSSGHRKNMLDSSFRESGTGAVQQDDGTIIIVQDYLLK
jgi:uncharacterized protein YkwD